MNEYDIPPRCEVEAMNALEGGAWTPLRLLPTDAVASLVASGLVEVSTWAPWARLTGAGDALFDIEGRLVNGYRKSGWCSPDCSPMFHVKCQMRIDKGQLAGCGCEARGGHQNAQDPHSVRDSGVADGTIGGTNKATPGGASTPLVQGSRRLVKESTDDR